MSCYRMPHDRGTDKAGSSKRTRKICRERSLALSAPLRHQNKFKGNEYRPPSTDCLPSRVALPHGPTLSDVSVPHAEMVSMTQVTMFCSYDASG